MDKREEHLHKTAKMEARTEQKIRSELTPYPSGKQFHKLFSKLLGDPSEIPYMSAKSLNKDIVLYRAMLIVLSYFAGKVRGSYSMDYLMAGLDSSNNAKQYHVNSRSFFNKIWSFMNGDAMVALRDNEYASNYHENGARVACYQVLEEVKRLND